MQQWLICSDSFKDAATAAAVCDALEVGLQDSGVPITTRCVPLSDGGDGFIACGKALGWGVPISVSTQDPLQRPIHAEYLWDQTTATAWIGVAEASGIQRLQPFERDGRITTSFGTGVLLHHALHRGAQKIFLGLGGSATNDGGCGMAQALGFEFLDTAGKPFLPTGATLSRITAILPPVGHPWKDVQFVALSDVHNPLCGPSGATFTFGPQKGIPATELTSVDAGMQHLAGLWQQAHASIETLPGTGAAGGLGAASMVFLKAVIQSGTQYMLTTTGLEQAVQQADAVITGEGAVDTTSFDGKLLSGILQLCQRYQKPCYLVCGQSRLSPQTLKEKGISRIFAVQDYHPNTAEAIANTLETLRKIGKLIPL